MLHPIAVFDGQAHYRERAAMPLIGDLDLHSPVAGLRAAMHRLTQDLAGARAQLAAAAGEARQLAQDKTALEDRRLGLEAALAEANASRLAVAEQARRLEDQIVQLRSARDDIERAAAAADAEWAQQRQELQDRAQTLDEDNRKLQAGVAGTRAYLAAVRGEAGELRATIDRQSAEWDEERRRSRDAAQALEGDVLRLREELAQISAELGNAQAEGAELRANPSAAARNGRTNATGPWMRPRRSRATCCSFARSWRKPRSSWATRRPERPSCAPSSRSATTSGRANARRCKPRWRRSTRTPKLPLPNGRGRN